MPMESPGADELANAELISPDQPFSNQRSYYMAYPPRNEMLMLPSVVAFRAWLLEQFDDYRPRNA